MAIADTIQSMYENVGEVYDTLTNVEVNNGKNLLPNDLNTTTLYGITATKNADGSITFTGTASGTSTFILCENKTININTSTYVLSTHSSGSYSGGNSYFNIYDNNNTQIMVLSNTNNSISKTFSSTSNLSKATIVFGNGCVIASGGFTIYPMLEKSNSVTSYEPYTDNPTYKNIENIPKVIRKSYLNIMNNGYQDIWDSWDKVNGSGTSVSLNNTEEAPMSLAYKGNTYQFTSNGTNLFNPAYVTTGATVSGNDITITSSGTGVVLAGTWAAFSAPTIFTIPSGKNYLIPIINGEEVNTIELTLQGHYTGSETMTNINSNTSITGGGYTLENPFEVTAIRVSTYGSTYSDLQGITFNFYVGPDNAYSPYGATPSPSLPSPVQVVSGDNSIVVCGKNLAPSDWASKFVNACNAPTLANITTKDNRNCLYYKINAGYGDYPHKNFTLGMTFKENTQYTISYDAFKVDATQKCLSIAYTDGTIQTGPLFSYVNTWEHQKITTTANKTVDYIFVGYYAGDTYIDIDSWQIEEGTTATTYEHYTGATYLINLPEGIELCKIGTYQDKIDKSSGKNLLDMNNLLVGIYTPSATPTISGSGDVYKSFNLTLKKGTYSLLASSSLYVVRDFSSYDYSGNATLGSFPANTKSTFTITQDATVYFSFRKYDNTAWDSTKDKVWLVEGSDTTDYEPYGTNWYVKKEIGKVVLDGSESWSDFSVGDINFRCQYDVALPNILTPPTNPAQLFSNYFKAINRDNAYAKTEIGIAQYGSTLGKVFICAPNTILSEQTLASWKTWLSTHNTIVYYVLATPTYETITDTTLLSQLEEAKKSYEEQTNISQVNNDMPFELDVVALSNGTVSTLGFSLGNPLSSSQPEEEEPAEEPEVDSEESL